MADVAFYVVGGLSFAASAGLGVLAYKKHSEVKFDPISAANAKDEKGSNDNQFKTRASLTGWIFNNRKISIHKELGRGNIGIVYSAEMKGQPCIVKRLFKEDISNKEMRIMQGLRRLVHPNLVQCLGICPNYTTPGIKDHASVDLKDSAAAVTMNKLDVALDHAFIVAYEKLSLPLFHSLHDPKKQFEWKIRLRIATAVAEAMEFLHSQKPPIIHGNLSSVNVLLNEDMVAKVSDFGMRAFAEDGKHGITSPLWAAPELFNGKKLQKSTDVYSFGVILWELMTRKVPYVNGVDRNAGNVRFQQIQKVKAGERPLIPEAVPEAMADLITSCWHQTPSRRPTFSKIVQSLAAVPSSVDVRNIDQIEVCIDGKSVNDSIDIVIPSKQKWMVEGKDIPLEGKGVRTIGQGSFGRVVSTTWKGTKVAVKLIDMYGQVTHAQAKAFINELSVLCALRHPNIVLFQGAVLSHEKYMCIIEELCQRGSLQDVLLDKTEVLDYRQQLQILVDTAEAMTYLHGFKADKPILHCDLKSGNILLTDDLAVKVCDFGLSQMMTHIAAGGNVGNPYWTAPEVMMGGKYTTAADVYSFGIVAWEVFARRKPFGDMGPHQATLAILTEDIRPKIPDFVPPAIAKLINDCWKKDAKSRPSFEEILKRLKQISEQGLPKETLTLENAKLYRKKTLVHAFRSKDKFIFHKVWGRSMSNPNDFVIIGPAGDAYTCAADRFEATYELAGKQPHVYKKKAKILAKKMTSEFLLETLEGLERGNAGSYLAQNPTKMEQWPIDAKTFEETYELCKTQILEAEDMKSVMTPTTHRKNKSSVRFSEGKQKNDNSST